MKRFHTALLLSVWILAAMTGCDKDPAPYGDFDNRVFIDQNTNVTTLLVKQSTESDEHSFRAATPKPVDKEVGLLFEADADRVANYNRMSGEEAAMLPENYYEIVGGKTSIPVGTNRSTDVTVRFHNLGELDTEALHVLPVTLRKADGVTVLESARTIYYVLRGAAIINVVADLQDSNYISFDKTLDGQSASCKVLNGLNAVTMEALVRCSDYVLEPGIKTVMGIEGHCLIRISDNGLEPNQLQVVMPTSYATANFTDATTCLIPANEWTHIAVTCDVGTGHLVVYINGETVLDKTGNQFVPSGSRKPTPSRRIIFSISVTLMRPDANSTVRSARCASGIPYAHRSRLPLTFTRSILRARDSWLTGNSTKVRAKPSVTIRVTTTAARRTKHSNGIRCRYPKLPPVTETTNLLIQKQDSL